MAASNARHDDASAKPVGDLVEVLAHRLEASMAARNWYGGICMTEQARIRLFAAHDGVSIAQDFVASMISAEECAAIDFVESQFSLADLQELQARFSARLDSMREHGVNPSSWGIDIRNNVFRIGLLEYTSSAVDTVNHYMGTHGVIVVQEPGASRGQSAK